jgi:hypothetical protein
VVCASKRIFKGLKLKLIRMKKLLFVLPFLILLNACKKDTLSVDATKYPVSFDVSNFTITQGTFSITSSNNAQSNGVKVQTATPLLSTNMNKLIYVVFDSHGNQVSRLEQNRTYTNPVVNSSYRVANGKKVLLNTTDDFGRLSDQLALGTYTLIVIGTDDWGSLNAPKAKLADTDPYIANTLSNVKFYPNSPPTSDPNYYYKGTLTVTATNSPQSIILSRIYGQIVLHIEDIIPANVASIYMQTNNDASYFDLNTTLPGGTVGHGVGYGLNPEDYATSDRTFAFNILNTTSNLTLEIRANDADGRPIIDKYVNNVPVAINKQTTVSGRLFSNTPAFSFTLNADWGVPNGTVHF